MFQPIATLVVGLAIAVIAFLQFKVAHDKLRLELFDRRFKVYAATKGLIIRIYMSFMPRLPTRSFFLVRTFWII
jgi:hypothetical protein